MNKEITCHKNAPFVGVANDGKVEWKERQHGNYPSPYDHCSYCGSISPESLYTILSEGGRLERSDFKYGWPHKFYVHTKNGEMLKWYNIHFLDLDDTELFKKLADFISAQTAIEFVREGNDVKYAVHSLARGWSEDYTVSKEGTS